MKVKELIELLQKQDPELECRILREYEYIPILYVKTEELTTWDDDETFLSVVIEY